VSFTVSDAIFRAIADCAPTEGIVPLTVRFRSRGEFEDGSIVRYRGDFEGDGRFDTSDPVARDFTRTFTTGGIREAVLEVTNNFGQVTTDTCTLRVSGTPPLVTTGAVPSNGAAPLIVDFVCDATDPDGVVALYEWDFEGDGVFDYSSPSSGAVSHTYTAEGTFPAVCRVTDGDGLVTQPPAFNTTVRVGPAGAPTVTAVADPTAGDAPLAVSFDGTATDDSVIVLWEWDFDGDGSYDLSSPSSPVAAHTYTAGGIFGAALRVTDDDGNTSIDEIQIDVDVAVSLAIPVDTFAPSEGETVSIETTLSGDAPMRLLLRDRAGQTVRTLFDGSRPAGTHVDVWDGLDAAGLPLPHDPYFAVVEYDVGDDTRVLDLTNTTGGTRYNPPRLGFPSVFRPLQDDLLEITFVIPSEASEVTAFIGLFRVDTRLVTLLEREPFGVGTHTIYWDGTGLTGSIAVPPPGDSFLFGIFGFTQPDNAVMLEAAPTLSDVSVEPNFFNPSTPDFLTPDDPVAVVTYSLDKQADIELTVTNLTTGVVVRTIVEPAVAPGAALTVAWDGHADDGLFADKSDYRLTLRAIDAAGNASINRFALVRLFH
jgi:PKD repeat protein